MSDGCGSCSSKSSDGSCADGSCSSTPGEENLKRNLEKITHKIVVLSGKGGVGKSSVATNIAMALAQAGKRTGLLDVDVHGPSVPRFLSLRQERPRMDRGCIEPVLWNGALKVMSLGFLLPGPDEAVIWRGPMKISLIRQFLTDVDWGDLDYLVVDCPPGTGDEPLTVLQLLGPDSKAIIVTTPQGVAVDDVRRSVRFVRELDAEPLGIVENMSGFVCPGCGQTHDIFQSGGGEALAKEMGVNFLGRIPMDPEVVRSGDEGFALLKVQSESPTALAFKKIVEPLLALG